MRHHSSAALEIRQAGIISCQMEKLLNETGFCSTAAEAAARQRILELERDVDDVCRQDGEKPPSSFRSLLPPRFASQCQQWQNQERGLAHL